jgi:cobalamin-dependent methionine synthase I
VTALQLSQIDRIRRNKLAGLLGSEYAGERSNALAMLQKMADAYKVRIDELLLADGNDGAGSSFDRQRAEHAERRAREAELRAQRAEQRTRSDEPAPDAPPLPPEWRDRFLKAQELNRSLCFLTSWEMNFVADLITRGTRWPSVKQTIVIVRILEKAGAFSAASAAAEDWEDAP